MVEVSSELYNSKFNFAKLDLFFSTWVQLRGGWIARRLDQPNSLGGRSVIRTADATFSIHINKVVF